MAGVIGEIASAKFFISEVIKMGLKEFGKKLNDTLDKLNNDLNNFANDASNQINAGIASLDSAFNGGLQNIGTQIDNAIGVPQEVQRSPIEPVAFNESAVEGLHGQNETSVQDIIREPINVVPNPNVVLNAVEGTSEACVNNEEVSEVRIPRAILDKIVEEEDVGSVSEEIVVENKVESESENNE